MSKHHLKYQLNRYEKTVSYIGCTLVMQKKTSLKKARESGSLDEFIKEHSKDPKGDADKLNKTIDRFTQSQSQNPDKSKSTPETSKPDRPER